MADHFNIDGSDAECVACLQQILPGNRGPKNVLTDVNPCNFHPRNLPEGSFYLVASNVPEFNEHGYWELLGVEIRIVKDSSCVGWLKNLEFYEGQAPNATKTNWIMQVYRLDDHEQQDRMLLCRVRHLIPDQELEQLLYEILAAEEENHQNSGHALHGGQVANGNEQGPAVGPDHAANILPLGGDYLELNDLIGYESSLSSGGNSSRLTFTSDDYMDDDFNSEAFLSDQESQTGPTPPNVNRCRAPPPPGSNQVVIEPPYSDGVKGEKKDTKVIPASSPTNDQKKAQKLSFSATPPGEQTPGNVEYRKNVVAKAEATPSTSTAQGGEKKKTSKITKIMKKFCFCFFS